MKKNAAPTCYGEKWDFDVGRVDLLTGVVIFVSEAILLLVGRLVLAIRLALFTTEISLDSIRTPICRLSARTTMLVTNDLPIPPKLDERITQDATTPTTIAVVITHTFPRYDTRQPF